MKVSELKVNPGNPRFIRDEKFEKLMDSIRRFPRMMEINQIKIDENNMILAGNMRFRAIQAIGYEEIPDNWINKVDGLTEEEKREFIIKDNVSYGEWDWEILANEWPEEALEEWGMDLPPDWETQTTDVQDDKYLPPDPDEIKTNIKLGDVFQIGPHVLVCGDSTKKEAYEQMMKEAETIDLVVTDPPYNVDYGSKAEMLDKYLGGNRNTQKIKNDNMSDTGFRQFLLDFFNRVIEHMKPGCPIYVFHAESTSTDFRNTFKECGLQLRQCLIWVKNSLVLGRQDYQWRHEPCLYGWKDGAGHYFTEERNNTTVWEDQIDLKTMSKADMKELLEKIFSPKTKTSVLNFDRPRTNDLHPTMKPVLLVAELIMNSSRKGEIVADPFGGSGTTMVAAHQLHRRCRMIEMDEKNVQVIIDRMVKLDPDIKITKNGKRYELPTAEPTA